MSLITFLDKVFYKLHLEDFWRKIKPHPMLPLWRRILQWVGIVVGGGFTFGFVFTLLIVLIFSRGLPPLTAGENFLQAQSTLILDREGNILYAIHGEENREIIELEDISPYLVDATLAIEDHEFYDHYGFDLPCLGKAVIHELFGVGIRRGCSTITQQLVKNLFLNPEQTYSRKIQELILAVRVEGRFTKDEILQMYLNEIPYGNNAYGAELAAQRYFGKAASELTLTESAVLAGLPKAPTRYSPYGENLYSHLLVEFTAEQLADQPIESEFDLDEEEYMRGLIGANITLADGTILYIPGRTDVILQAMVDQDMITEEQADASVAESLTLVFKEQRDNIVYPHFVFYVKQLLEDKYGKDVVEQGGLKVYTTIDPKMQDIAEETIATYRERNMTQYGASNASLVSIHPQTGQILAMVGSADYWDETIDGNVNIALRPRQPGSSFKPFVYSLAFLNGYAPATIIYDTQTQFGPGEYPQNYDGTFHGPMTIREALGQSRNIPAIKAYFLAGKEEAIIPYMENFGIDLDETIGYGWPLALGSGEVSLLDMVEGYSVFANAGVKHDITAILKVENKLGEVLEQWEDEPGVEAIDPQVAYLITDILSDESVHLGPRLTIAGQYVAAKTGTSNKKSESGDNVPSNNWIIGYSTKLVTGVWVGNADGTELSYYADGYTTAAPIWNDFMTQALADITPEEFPRPAGIVEMAVTKSSGLLPSKTTPDDMIRTDIFATFNVPTDYDNRFVTLQVDKLTELIATEYSPTWSIEEKSYQVHKDVVDYPYWQAGVDAWVAGAEGLQNPPTEMDNLHTADTLANAPSVVITNPTTYSTLNPGTNTIEVEVEALNGMDKIEFYLNDTLHFTSVSSPYSGTVRIPVSSQPGAIYEITTYIYDDLGYRGESTIEIQVKTSADESTTEEIATEEETVEELLDAALPRHHR